MAGQLGFWSVEERPGEISAQGDPLETLAATVDFELFRPVLTRALGKTPRWKGGQPGFDAVLKFRMLVLQSLHGLSLEATEYLVRGPPLLDAVLSAGSRRCGAGRQHALGLPGGPDPRRGARRLVRRAGPRDHGGRLPAAGWPDRGRHSRRCAAPEDSPRERSCRPRKAGARPRSGLRSRLRRARRTSRRTGRCSAPSPRRGPTAPRRGSPSRRPCSATSRTSRSTGCTGSCAARSPPTPPAHDGGRLREGLIQRANTARDVWADSAYRSTENEAWLAEHGMTSRIHRKKPQGPADAQADPSGQRPPRDRTGPRRARLRPPEGTHGAGDPHYRPGPRPSGDHARQHGLQYGALAVAQRSSGARLTPRGHHVPPRRPP